MDNARIREVFEAYFEKYKKTEGDNQGGVFEINMTKCPKGTRFKLFSDKRKIGEIEGWDAFLGSLDRLEKDYGPAFERGDFFTQMEEML